MRIFETVLGNLIFPFAFLSVFPPRELGCFLKESGLFLRYLGLREEPLTSGQCTHKPVRGLPAQTTAPAVWCLGSSNSVGQGKAGRGAFPKLPGKHASHALCGNHSSSTTWHSSKAVQSAHPPAKPCSGEGRSCQLCRRGTPQGDSML